MKDLETDTVTLTRAEYEALVEALEDAEDLAAYWKAKAKVEDALPAAYAARIVEGESLLAVYRDWRGFSQSALAREAGVNRVQIADIEAGRANGSVATLRKLADVLRISLDDLA